MTHIHGMQDTDLHDENGHHVRPVYQAPREHMPDDGEIARVTGPVVRGRDVERAHANYRSAMVRFNQHLDAHEREL